MTTYRTTLLVGILALGLFAFAGCDCGKRAECAPPVAIAKPAPAPVYYAPKPVQGVCWTSSLDQPVVMPNPPSVTLDRQGRVVSSTPTGRLQPPSSDLAFGVNRY